MITKFAQKFSSNEVFYVPSSLGHALIPLLQGSLWLRASFISDFGTACGCLNKVTFQ